MNADNRTVVDAGDLFATTHWSVVLAAETPNEHRRVAALQSLCNTYWRPVYVFVRHKGFSHEDSEELTQEYFAALLRAEAFTKLDPARGKFRGFLLSSLKHFLANEWDRRKTLKRGGNRVILSLDETAVQIPLSSKDSPDINFDRRWALSLLESVMAKLEADYTSLSQRPLFAAIKPLLIDSGSTASYASIASVLGLSEGAIKVAVHRIRKRYAELLRKEIAQTVTSQSEIEEELRHLLQLFA